MKKLLYILPLFSLIFLTSCEDYGKKVKKGHVETYYKNDITEAQAQRAADVIYNVDINAGNAPVEKSFQLTKENSTIHFRMVVDKSKMDQIKDINYLAIANIISDSVFNGAPVDLDLTDNKFKLIRNLPYKKVTDADFQ